jgi:hypothetical protein
MVMSRLHENFKFASIKQRIYRHCRPPALLSLRVRRGHWGRAFAMRVIGQIGRVRGGQKFVAEIKF